MSMEHLIKGFIILILSSLILSCKNEEDYKFSLTDDSSSSSEIIFPLTMNGSCITSPYGPRKSGYHHGIDLRTKQRETSSVFAIADGTVVASTGNNSEHSGEYIKIYHESLNIYSIYVHLSSKYVKQGNIVKKGEIIGVSGETGKTFGEHLHFGIKDKYNSFIDPAVWMEDHGLKFNLCKK